MIIKVFTGSQFNKVRTQVLFELQLIKDLRHENIASFSDIFYYYDRSQEGVSLKLLSYAMDYAWFGDLDSLIRGNHI